MSNIDLDFQQASVEYNHTEAKGYLKCGTFARFYFDIDPRPNYSNLIL